MSESNDRDLYTPPESNLVNDNSNSSSADKIFVGKNYEEYYRSKFERFDSTGTKKSWNWVSFFFTWPWLLYRKMWLNALLYIFALPIVLMLLLAGASMVLGELAIVLYWILYVVIMFVIVPVISNWLYYSHARKKIAVIDSSGHQGPDRVAELTRKGGTSSIALIIIVFLIPVVLGIIAAIAIPAYSSYVQKAKFTETVQATAAVRSEIEDCYQQTQDLLACDGPYDTSTIVASYDYVSDLQVVEGAEIISTGSSDVRGMTYILTPVITGEGLSWEQGGSCVSARLC